MKLLVEATYKDGQEGKVCTEIAQVLKGIGYPQKVTLEMKDGNVKIFYDSGDERSSATVNLARLMAVLENITTLSYQLGRAEAVRAEIAELASAPKRIPISQTTVNRLLGTKGGRTEQTEQHTKDAPKRRAEKKADTGDGAKARPPRTGWGGGPTIKSRVLGCFDGLPDGHPGIGAKYITQEIGVQRSQVASMLVQLTAEGKIVKVKRGLYTKCTSVQEAEELVPTAAEVAAEPEAEPVVKLKNPRTLKEIPGFDGIHALLNLSSPCDENIKLIMGLLYEKIGIPEASVKADLEARMAAAATIPSDQISWETISMKLEEYDVTVTENTMEKTDKYILQGFEKLGYKVGYIKFLKLISKVFGTQYHGKQLHLSKKTSKLRVRIPCMPENAPFEELLGEVAGKKSAGNLGLDKILIHMGLENEKDPKVREDIREVFRVAMSLKNVSSDYLQVRGNYKNSAKMAIRYTEEFVNTFAIKISSGQQKKVPFMQFLKQLQTAIKGRV